MSHVCNCFYLFLLIHCLFSLEGMVYKVRDFDFFLMLYSQCLICVGVHKCLLNICFPITMYASEKRKPSLLEVKDRWLVWVQDVFVIEYLLEFMNSQSIMAKLTFRKLNFCQLWWVKLISSYYIDFVYANVLLKAWQTFLNWFTRSPLVWLLSLVLLLKLISKHFKCKLQFISGQTFWV